MRRGTSSRPRSATTQAEGRKKVEAAMDASELKGYEQQLAQVQGALSTDRDNQELLNLEIELKNLIALTRQLLEAAEVPAAGPSNKKPATATTSQAGLQSAEVRKYTAGEECQAKYAGDGRWYSARIVAVGGSTLDPRYTILYKGYDSTEIVTSASLRPLRNAASHTSITTTNNKRPASAVVKLTPEEEREKERKRKRSEKKAERSASKSAEANAMQNTWQKFAKKAEKKGTLKTDKSMFKTPDDPLAKVGVVGAGRGMTSYGDRKKHLYDADQ